MTKQEITALFQEVLHEKHGHGATIEGKLPNITRNQVYNWRNDRTKPTMGDMLEVLYGLEKIEIKILEPVTESYLTYDPPARSNGNMLENA